MNVLNNDEFTINECVINDMAYYIAYEITSILEFGKKGKDIVDANIDSKDKTMIPVSNKAGYSLLTAITKSGVDRLTEISSSENAARFKKWLDSGFTINTKPIQPIQPIVNSDSEIKIFENEEFGSIRSVIIEDEVWFIGHDVATSLGYQKPRNAVAKYVDDVDALKWGVSTNVGKREMTIINESGLYSLILSSKLPNARKFRYWVTSEVLPSIRKNGGYIANQENLSSEQILANAVLVAQNVIAEKDRLLKLKDDAIEGLTEVNDELKPKAEFADAVNSSTDCISVGDLSKLLKQNGIDIGCHKLFAWLRENGYLLTQGSSYNSPSQKSINLGLMKMKETTIISSFGKIKLNITSKITGKGQTYFIKKFLKLNKGENL